MATNSLDGIDKLERENWLGLRRITCVEAHEKEVRSGKKSVGKRYELSGREPEDQVLERLIPQHWGIENQCPWILDMTWQEDGSQLRYATTAI